MTSTSRKRLPGYAAAGILAVALVACDSDNVAVVDEDEQSEELKTFLEAPPKSSGSGAHRQNDPHAELSADKLAQVALQHLDESRPELAMETLNSALAKYPRNAMLLSLRASLFLQQQQPSLALADLNRAVEINPQDPILLTNRAQALRQFGRKDDARRDLDRAIELDPGFIAAHFNRGSLHFEAGQYDLALADFNRCIELQPDVPAPYFNRASTWEALGKRDQAISDLERFLSLKPEPTWAQVARDLLTQWDSNQS